MTTLLIIIGMIAIVAAILEKKSRKRSEWDDDPFFGTPLQKVD